MELAWSFRALVADTSRAHRLLSDPDMIFASLARLLRRDPKPQAVAVAPVAETTTAPLPVPPVIVPLLDTTRPSPSGRPTITVWIGDASYQALVV